MASSDNDFKSCNLIADNQYWSNPIEWAFVVLRWRQFDKLLPRLNATLMTYFQAIRASSLLESDSVPLIAFIQRDTTKWNSTDCFQQVTMVQSAFYHTNARIDLHQEQLGTKPNHKLPLIWSRELHSVVRLIFIFSKCHWNPLKRVNC